MQSLLLKLGLSGLRSTAQTDSALEVLPGEAGSSGSRAGGTSRVVEVPKISCQGKVEVVKSILQERNSGRMEKQSRVMKVPKISCQENDEVFERMCGKRGEA